MKIFILAILLATVVATQAHGGGWGYGWRWGCWWRWGWDCPRCTPYKNDSHVCCKEYESGCCMSARYLHTVPPCTNTTATSYWADPCNCAKFYQCYQGKVNHFMCPIRGAWDQGDLECKKVYTFPPPFCGSRPYTSPRLPVVYAEFNITALNATSGQTFVSFKDVAPYDSVYNIMAYFAGTRTDFSFKSTYNKRFWYSIQCIVGVCADYAKDMTYWAFKINGVASNVGTSSAFAKANNVISFELTKGGGH